MAFEIDIVVDPSKAVPNIAKVEAELGKVETRAPRVGAAVTRGMREGAASATQARGSVTGFGDALARVANYQRILAGEAAAARAAVTNLAGAFGQLGAHLRNQALQSAGKAFAGLTEQLQREADVLERIKGPMREHIADMQALTMLYKRGAISAAEHNAEASRLRGQVGLGPAKGGGAGAGGGLAAVGGKLAAAAGIAYSAKQVLDVADAYTSLENRLRQVTSGEAELASMMERTRAVANGARMEWSAVGESFVRLTGATKQLGLSQDQVLNLTDNLSKTVQLSGASSTEAAAGMLQLSQAFASGRLQGDEFRSVSENLPIVMDMLAKQMGVTRGELKKMAADGKITSDVLAKTFLQGEGEIENAFGKTVTTAAQQWTVFKNELTATAGELVRSSQIIPLLGGALQSVMNVVKPLASVLGGLVGVLADIGGAVHDVGAALGLDLKIGMGTIAGMVLGGPFGAALGTLAEAALPHVVDSLTYVDDMLADVKAEMASTPPLFNELADAVEEAADQMNRLVTAGTSMKAIAGVPGSLLGGWSKATGAVNMFFDDPWGDSRFKQGLQALGFKEKGDERKGRGKAKDPWEGWSTFRAFDTSLGRPSLEQTINAGGSDLTSLQKGFDDEVKRQQKVLEDYGKFQSKLDEELARSKKQADGLGRTLEHIGEQTMDQLYNAAVSFGDALTDAIFEADFSWSKFIQNMAKDLVRMSARSLIQIGISAATGSAMPGAATGGSWQVGGSGGTDSQIAMLRVTPRETITVNTPGQLDRGEGAGQGAARAGGRKMVTVEQPDGSRARFVTEDDFEELFVRMTDRHAPMLRSRFTGR